MKKPNSLQTIDDILLHDIGDEVDHTTILKVIYCYYLNDAERELYNASLLYYSGKTQKDIGILLNMHRSYFALALSKLMIKMKAISKVLYYERDVLQAYMLKLKSLLLFNQYRCISLLFGGNNYVDTARILKCSVANITRLKKSAIKRLPKSDAHILVAYLDIFKKTQFYKK